MRLLTALGSLLAASAPRYSAGRILLDYTRALGGRPECALIGSSERTACVNAALYNGSLGYYCDIDAHHPGAIMHAPAIVVPVALALDPVRPLLYVASSNADLMYNGATINVLDVWKLPAKNRGYSLAGSLNSCTR